MNRGWVSSCAIPIVLGPTTPGVGALRRAFVNAAYQAIVASAPPADLAD